MENAIIFDSAELTRKLSITVAVLTPDSRILLEKQIIANRFLVRATDWYNRFEIHFEETTLAADMMDYFNEFKKAINKYGYDAYMALTVYPEGAQNKQNRILFFISNANIIDFDRDEINEEKVIFTGQIDKDFFTYINGEKFTNGNYAEMTQKAITLTEEEMAYIQNATQRQCQPDWFPSARSVIEAQRKNAQLKKKKDKQENSGNKPHKGNQQIDTGASQFVNPKSFKIHKGSVNPEQELNNITGLDNVKRDIDKMKSMLEYEKSRSSRGIKASDGASMHMCFLGNPGTGKTTIARIMTGILYNMKYIKKNQCIEVSGLDLKGGFVGQTGIITKAIVDKAKGGILFVDEAYALCEDRGNSFGKEAISVLLKEMEDNRGDLVVILAGYEDDMDKFLNVNPGFRSRINKYFDFLDYTCLELSDIFFNILKKMHLKIEPDAFEKCVKLFAEAKKHSNFSNGRFARNLAEQIEEYHILNTVNESDERMDIITIDDIPDKLIENMLRGM